MNRHRIITVETSSDMIRVAYAIGKDADRQAGQMGQFRDEELSQLIRYERGTCAIRKEKATTVHNNLQRI